MEKKQTKADILTNQVHVQVYRFDTLMKLMSLIVNEICVFTYCIAKFALIPADFASENTH